MFVLTNIVFVVSLKYGNILLFFLGCKYVFMYSSNIHCNPAFCQICLGSQGHKTHRTLALTELSVQMRKET